MQVLTRRLGNPALLAIVYSELVKVLKSWGVIEFVVDMMPPKNKFSLPQPVVRKGPLVDTIMDSEPPELFTPKALLAEVIVFMLNLRV